MTSVIRGHSICPLCNNVLEEDRHITALPAFLPCDHKFGKFSDSAFHTTCFESHPDYYDVRDIYYVYKKIMESKPANLTCPDKVAAWEKDVFQGWPPKNGVIIYEQCFADDGEEADWWWSDKDSWEEFEKAEAAAHKEQEERYEESRRREREALRYVRDDD